MKIDVAALSGRGPRVENEDSVINAEILQGYFLIGVADGLGGHAGGKTASTFALQSLLKKLSRNPNSNLAAVSNEIHFDLRNIQLTDSAHRRMATTLSAALLYKNWMNFVHCGDTRIAVARGSGIKRLTTDHSEAQRLYDLGKLSRDQFKDYPRKNILESALGIQGTPRIDQGRFELLPGDKIFITSDGLHNRILLRELFSLARTCSNSKAFVEKIADEMNGRSADDNYSLVCAFVH